MNSVSRFCGDVVGGPKGEQTMAPHEKTWNMEQTSRSLPRLEIQSPAGNYWNLKLYTICNVTWHQIINEYDLVVYAPLGTLGSWTAR